MTLTQGDVAPASLERDLQESKDTPLLPSILRRLSSISSSSSSSRCSKSCLFSSLSARVRKTMERRMTRSRRAVTLKVSIKQSMKALYTPSRREMARVAVEGSPGNSCLGLAWDQMRVEEDQWSPGARDGERRRKWQWVIRCSVPNLQCTFKWKHVTSGTFELEKYAEMEKISSGVIHTSIPPPPWLPACNHKY